MSSLFLKTCGWRDQVGGGGEASSTPGTDGNLITDKIIFGLSFRCEHKIFSPNLKRGPNCQEAAPRHYCGAPSRHFFFFFSGSIFAF